MRFIFNVVDVAALPRKQDALASAKNWQIAGIGRKYTDLYDILAIRVSN
jgi:hypothetical protein